jgi:putative SOS response-associated peptidase YedK
MCGRFVSASPPDEIARYFDAEAPETALEPSYNVAPTNDVYAVTADGGVRRVEAYHWGLVPRWAKDPKIGSKMINARSETLATKNAYKPAFKRRRCIIPADGFYEWQRKAAPAGEKPKGKKRPHYIHSEDGAPLAIAGLWEVWQGPSKDSKEGDDSGDSQALHSCTIITTTPNDTMAKLHDRMPVLLPASAWDEWLDPTNDDLDTLGKLLVPAPSELITTYPVSTAVNSVRNKGPELLDEHVGDPELPLDD